MDATIHALRRAIARARRMADEGQIGRECAQARVAAFERMLQTITGKETK
jgi:hypothetical protein